MRYWIDRAPISALIVYNSNPVAVAPDSTRVARGFAREDLFTVVLEHFQTDTADYADILLPATTQLEHLDVVKPYGHYYMVANNPAIAPLGECKPNTEIFRLLAKAMGFTEPCFNDSDEAIAQAAVAQDWDFKAVRAVGWKRVGAPTGVARFADGGFDTPSGKVEFFSARAEALGLDPLPDYIAPQEDTRSAAASRYPLAMISPPARNFLNSSFVNVQSLRAAEGEPWLDIHPDDAAKRGVSAGGYVRVFNDRGSIELRARVTDRARRGRRGGPVGLVEETRPRRQECQRTHQQRHAHRHGASADVLRLPGAGRSALSDSGSPAAAWAAHTLVAAT